MLKQCLLLPCFVTPSSLRAFVAPSGLNGHHFPDFSVDSSVCVQYLKNGCSAVPAEGLLLTNGWRALHPAAGWEWWS